LDSYSFELKAAEEAAAKYSLLGYNKGDWLIGFFFL